MSFGEVPAFINSANDLIVIALVVLLFFGANKIPEMMRGLGQGMKEFKKGMDTDAEPDISRTAQEEEEARRRARIEEEVRAEMERERRQTS